MTFGVGCSKPEGGGAAATASSAPKAQPPPVAASSTPSPSASVAAAPPPPCSSDPAFSIDKGGRLETGLTVVELENGKEFALGYAVGEGTPRVALFDEAGAVTKADPDWSHVKEEEPKKDPKMIRHLFRVTPLGKMKNGKMRIGMDLLDAYPDKGQGSYLRCGPAEVEPVISDEGGAQFDDPTEDDVAKLTAGSDTDGAAVDFRDCRTFGNAKRAFVLATQVKRDGPGDDHDLLFQWLVDDAPGKGLMKDSAVDKRVVKPNPDHKYPKPDHFITPLVADLGDKGFFLAARDQGKLVFVKRTAKLEKAGDASSIWLGAPAAMPAINVETGQVFIVTSEAQKTDLFGVGFPVTAKPEKPHKVDLADTAPPAEGWRDSASLDVTTAGDVVVGFVDGKPPQRRARLTVLDGTLKQKMPVVFDVAPADAAVQEARVFALASGKILVTTLLMDGAINGQLVTCKY
jgi:hypothetical protein